MIAAFFRKDRPTTFPAMLVLVPILAGPLWSMGWKPVSGEHMPFYGLLVLVMELHAVVPFLLSILLVGLLAALVTKLANDLELFDLHTRLPLFLLPVLLSLRPVGLAPDAVLAGMPAALAGLRCAWVGAERSRSLADLFNAGLWIGIAALFHLPFAFLVVVIWSSNAVMRPFSWREYVVPLIGVALLIYLAWGIHLVFGWDWMPLATMVYATSSGSATGAWVDALRVLLLASLGLSTVLVFARGYQRSVMRGKNIRSAFLGFVLTCTLLAGAEHLLTGSHAMAWLALPLAVLFTYPLLSTARTWAAEMGAWALLLLALWTQWGVSTTFAA